MVSACSGSIDAPDAPRAPGERVFVEAVLADLDNRQLALARSLDMDRVFTTHSIHVISSLGGIAERGVPLVFDPTAQIEAKPMVATDADLALERFEVTPTFTGGSALSLDMKLEISAPGSQHRFSKTEHFSGAQLLVWDTTLKTRAGDSIVLLVQPTVIENEQDLRAILARRSAGAAPGDQ